MHRSIFALAAGSAIVAMAANTDAGAANVLEHDTFLFSDEAPSGRLFAAGDEHPGDGWVDQPVTPVKAPVEATGEPGPSVDERIDAALAEQAEKFDTAYGELLTERDLLADENKKLQAKVDEQAAMIAKFDPDGDGKPGGSAPKAAK